MHITKVHISRISIRDRGSVSEVAIDGEILIQPDNPNMDVIRQSVPENIRVDMLPVEIQTHIWALIASCQSRLEAQYTPLK